MQFFNFSECGVRNWDCNWKESKKSAYFGKKSTTKNGHTCERWNRVKLSENPYPRETHNYCRCGNTDDCEQGPWCYIFANKVLSTDDCEVRDCHECDSGELIFFHEDIGHCTLTNNSFLTRVLWPIIPYSSLL